MKKRYDEEKYAEAKKMYFRYGCDAFFMYHEGEIERYVEYDVPRELEHEWDKKYLENQLTALKDITNEMEGIPVAEKELFSEVDRAGFVLYGSTDDHSKLPQLIDKLFVVVSNTVRVSSRFDDGKILDLLVNSIMNSEKKICLWMFCAFCQCLLDYIKYITDDMICEEDRDEYFAWTDKAKLALCLNRIEAMFLDVYARKIKEADIDSVMHVESVRNMMDDLDVRKNNLQSTIAEYRTAMNDIGKSKISNILSKLFP